ncbi:hypothetical protein [Pseudomonas paraeruginosa]|uniref:hypothetical protein n=1 Tax=Pseudomonas paraeruginosa TaxID=2994495 RepID=UPI0039FD4525
MTVKPISDEELDVAERLSVSREVSATATWILNGTVSAIIARLRAAEADAKRYLHLRNSGMIAAGRVGRHSISIPHYDTTDAERKELDDFLDAAMERTP